MSYNGQLMALGIKLGPILPPKLQEEFTKNFKCIFTYICEIILIYCILF